MDGLRGKLLATVDTAIRQVAASVVSKALRRGASVIALEDLTGFTDDVMDRTAQSMVGTGKREARKRFLRWHNYALREAISNAAELAGMTVRKIAPAHTSQTCHACGEVWTTRRQDGTFGPLSGYRFVCSCGWTGSSPRNASINIARLAAPEWVPPQKAGAPQPGAKIPRGTRATKRRAALAPVVVAK